jgi:phosphotransferase family enzyme
VHEPIPTSVLAVAVGAADPVVVACREQPIAGGTGAATGTVTRLVGLARAGGRERPFTIVRKQFRPLADGRHAAGATDPRHWAYWRREPLAYASGVLPTGPGLAAPRCYGVVDDVPYIQDVTGTPESPRVAARRLGAWHASTPVPDLPWLAGHQLAQRLAVSELDWNAVDANPRLASVWSRRHDLLADLRSVPEVLSHGDFHIGQLVATDGLTVVLDWATLGVSPVGADLAHLALSTLDDLVADYLAGLAGRFDPDAVRAGYRTTLALTGASRIHWMLSGGMPVPRGYAEFVIGSAAGVEGVAGGDGFG